MSLKYKSEEGISFSYKIDSEGDVILMIHYGEEKFPLFVIEKERAEGIIGCLEETVDFLKGDLGIF